MKLKDTIRADLEAIKIPVREDSSLIRLIRHILWALLYSPGFACVFMYRFNHWLDRRNLPFRKFLQARRIYMFGNDINPSASIGPGLRLAHISDVVIGGNVVMGSYVQIMNGVTVGGKSINGAKGVPKVGSNVFIGSGAKVIGDITVGDNVIIGALTYCDKSIPSNAVAFGNPMRILTEQVVIRGARGILWQKEETLSAD